MSDFEVWCVIFDSTILKLIMIYYTMKILADRPKKRTKNLLHELTFMHNGCFDLDFMCLNEVLAKQNRELLLFN